MSYLPDNDDDVVSIDTSTNATMSDLPGPGRILGNVYIRLGAPLERAYDRFAKRHTTNCVDYNTNTIALSVEERHRHPSGRATNSGPYSSYPPFSHDSDYISIISSNATMSNLPGPGRVLGNMYSRLGAPLTHTFNRLAEWRRLGPRMVAVRIVNRHNQEKDLKRRSYRNWKSAPKYTKKEVSEQKKDIKKLIRYSTSKTESTRKQALDGIVLVSLRDGLLHELLKGSKAAQILKQQEQHVLYFCDNSVQLSSKLALACIKDETLFQLVKSYCHDPHNTSLVTFMRRNRGQFYLAFHMLQRFIRRVPLYRVLQEVENIIALSPTLVEWDGLDQLIETWFATYQVMPLPRRNNTLTSTLLWLICHYEDYLPKTFQSPPFQDWLCTLESVEDLRSHYHLADVLVERGTSPKQASSLSLLLRPYDNPADSILSDIAKVWAVEYTLYLEPLELARKCNAMVIIFESDIEYYRRRALLCSQYLFRFSVHAQETMLHAVAHVSFVDPVDYTRLMDSAKKLQPHDRRLSFINKIKWIRHCDEQGYVTHVDYPLYDTLSIPVRLYPMQCTTSCHTSHSLEFYDQEVCKIRFRRGEPLKVPESPYIVPLVAGRYPDGRIAYLGEAACPKYDESVVYALHEGMKAEDCVVERQIDGACVKVEYIDLYVLRYAPDAYPQYEKLAPDVLMAGQYYAPSSQHDARRGPYFWEFEKIIPLSEKGLLVLDSDDSESEDGELGTGDAM